MRLLLIEGLSRNDVMTLMTRQLCAAFQAVGVEARCAPAGPANLAEVLQREFAQGGFDGVFSFASFGAETLGPDGRSLYEALPYGFVGWNVDHPSYQYARMTARLARRHTICASEDHFSFIDLMGGRGRKLVMLPGAEADPAPKPWAQRRIPVLVAMSWMGRPERWWAQAQGTPVHALMEAMLERLMADAHLNVAKAYRDAARATGFRAPFDTDLSSLIARLITYVRQYDRLKLIEGLRAANIPFTLCGDSWGDAMGPDPQISYRPPTDMAGLNVLYGDCQVVVNLNAANGGSERALSAMGAGAAVVSDPGSLLARSFGDEVAFYDRTNVLATIGVIGDLIESRRGEAMATAAGLSVQASHLWTHRAQSIAEALRTAWL